MSSNNRNRQLNLDSAEDREILMEKARRYFIHSTERVSEEIRLVDNVDIHLWVSRFIHEMVRMGRIHDDVLAANIVQLTYALWIEAMHIAGEHEQAVDDGVHNDD